MVIKHAVITKDIEKNQSDSKHIFFDWDIAAPFERMSTNRASEKGEL